ncbi:MAG TPA: sugar phosphate isomerase/epimerase family protein [Polyangiaceae bacterium]
MTQPDEGLSKSAVELRFPLEKKPGLLRMAIDEYLGGFRRGLLTTTEQLTMGWDKVKLGAHVITWGADWRQAIQDIGSQGVTGVETWPDVVDNYWGREQELVTFLADHGVQLICLYGGGKMSIKERQQQDIDRNVRMAEFLGKCGAQRMNLGGGDRKGGNYTDDDFKVLAETMNLIGEKALGFGVKAHYHPHLNTLGEQPHEIDRIFELTDPRYVFAGPDPAHLYLGGYDPTAFVRKYASRIVYFHFKDVTQGLTPQNWKDKSGRSPSQGAEREVLPLFTELGTGDVPLESLVQTIFEIGYEGWLTMEIDSTTLSSPLESLMVNKRYLIDKLGHPKF